MSDTENPDGPVTWDTEYGRILRATSLIVSVLVVILVSIVLIMLLIHTGFSFWQEAIKERLLGTIGLVGISVVSFGMVTFLRQSDGPIEFEALGMKFKGTSGQVILWGSFFPYAQSFSGKAPEPPGISASSSDWQNLTVRHRFVRRPTPSLGKPPAH